jgi:hypothetical protein
MESVKQIVSIHRQSTEMVAQRNRDILNDDGNAPLGEKLRRAGKI